VFVCLFVALLVAMCPRVTDDPSVTSETGVETGTTVTSETENKTGTAAIEQLGNLSHPPDQSGSVSVYLDDDVGADDYIAPAQPLATWTPSGYTFDVSVSATNYLLIDDATGATLYSSTHATQVANLAIGKCNTNESVYFTAGTYNLMASITAANKDNITLAFEAGAKLHLANGVNTAVMFLTGCHNWIIQGITIDGNAANQLVGGWPPPDGIAIYNNCSNILVDGAIIDNCRMYGFVAWSEVTNCGIRNSKITNCGWNCIQLGSDVNAISTEVGLYAINNECAFCSDVGITTYGIGNLIQGNYIHDMTGTTGSANSRWGIGVEGGHGHTIAGNTLVNCRRAMSIETTDGIGLSFVTNNTITTCGFGIVVDSPNNTITNNTISNFDMYGWGQQAIAIEGNYGGANYNRVLNNTISSTNGIAHAVLINSANDTQFNDNRINVPRTGTSWYSIQISASSRTQISRNTIIGFMGIIIADAACQATTINDNDLTQCNAETGAIANYGTGTIIYGNLI
jgi:Right handed beta helix region